MGTLVATALLGHRGRGLARSLLLARCATIIDYLESAFGRLSDALLLPEHTPEAVLEAVHSLVDLGTVAVDRPGRSDTSG